MVIRVLASLVCVMLCAPASLCQSSKVENQLQQLQQAAEQALDRGDSAAAIAIAQRGLKLRHNWKEGLWTLGWALFQTKQYGPARDTFVNLVRLDESKGASWLLLGLCEFQARDYGMALDDLLRGRSLGIPTSLGITSQVRYSTAVALLLSQRYDRAVQFFEEAAHEKEHTDAILLAWGLAAMRMPVDPQHAQDLFTPSELAMLHSIGEAMFRAASHELKDTDNIYNDLFRQYPSTVKLHDSYGFLLLRLGNLGEAEPQFRAELEVDPNSVMARLGLGYVALEQDRANDAIKLGREATELEPGSSSTHLLLGKALLAESEKNEAVAELELARDLDPANMLVHFLLARAYVSVKRNSDAEHERSEYLRLKQMNDVPALPR